MTFLRKKVLLEEDRLSSFFEKKCAREESKANGGTADPPEGMKLNENLSKEKNAPEGKSVRVMERGWCVKGKFKSSSEE